MNTATAPVFSLHFARSYWIHMRPYLLFVSGAAGWLGLALSENQIADWKLAAAILPLFFSYGFGQALTDCFQTDTDGISSSYRPLVQGIVRREDVYWTSLALLAAVTLTLFLLNPANLVVCALAIAGLATYTISKRNHWALGPPHNGLIVMLLPWMGILSASEIGGAHGWPRTPVLALASGLTLLSYMNFVLIGYLKDIGADRATGYRTFPVVFGWNPTMLAGDVIGIASATLGYLLISARAGLDFFQTPAPWLLWAAGTGCMAFGQVHGHRVREKVEANSRVAVTQTVRSFVLWHLGAIVAFRPEWAVLALGFYAAFEWVLAHRPEAAQI